MVVLRISKNILLLRIDLILLLLLRGRRSGVFSLFQTFYLPKQRYNSNELLLRYLTPSSSFLLLLTRRGRSFYTFLDISEAIYKTQ